MTVVLDKKTIKKKLPFNWNGKSQLSSRAATLLKAWSFKIRTTEQLFPVEWEARCKYSVIQEKKMDSISYVYISWTTWYVNDLHIIWKGGPKFSNTTTRMLKQRQNTRTAVADSVLMNSQTQKILCCIVAILLSTDAAAWLCARRAL
jgi:hypothetical protein